MNRHLGLRLYTTPFDEIKSNVQNLNNPGIPMILVIKNVIAFCKQGKSCAVFKNARQNNNQLITYYQPVCYFLKNTTMPSEYYLQYSCESSIYVEAMFINLMSYFSNFE